jgi:hypothetical protein
LVWTKVSLAFSLAVLLPGFEPYPYIPVNPKEPQAETNPEQTASLISFLFYLWLDPLVFKAYRLPHFGVEHLPPLSDYDYAKNLITRSYKHLDPFSGAPRDCSLFWGICRIFRVSLTKQSIIIIVMSLATLVTPVAINRLLDYLENGDGGATIRPWFWILLLFCGPLFNTLAFQLYIFFSVCFSPLPHYFPDC